jgi:ribonuclease-3
MEWGQKNRLGIEFELIETLADKDGGIVFKTSVSIERNPLATGIGNTKKMAQQAAAKTLLRKIHKDKTVRELISALKEK